MRSECNFPFEILLLFREITYWEKFFIEGDLEIPHDVLTLCQRQEEMRIMRERVVAVTRIHSDILNELQGREEVMFSDHLKKVDQVMRPGWTTIFWKSRPSMVDRYYAASLPALNETYRLVKRFKQRLSNIQKCCQGINSISFICMDKYVSFSNDEFKYHQEKCVSAAKEMLLTLYENIKSEIRLVIQMFHDCSNEVQREIQTFVSSIENDVKSVLNQAVKRSLLNLCVNMKKEERPFGGQRTLFSITLFLTNDRIECKPTLIELTHVVNKVAKEVIRTAQLVPAFCAELSAELKIQDEKKEHTSVLYNPDDKTLMIVKQIMDNMSSCTMAVVGSFQYWERYSTLWCADKNAYERKVLSDQSNSKELVNELKHNLIHHEKQLQALETEDLSATIDFIRLDYAPLKEILITHCIEWKDMLTRVLDQRKTKNLRIANTAVSGDAPTI